MKIVPKHRTHLPNIAPKGSSRRQETGGGKGFEHIFPPLAGVPDLRYCAPNVRFAEGKENRAKTVVPAV